MKRNPQALRTTAGLVLVPALALAAVALLPGASFAQEEGYAFRLANFSLEILGGWAKLDPSDLNEFAYSEETYLRYYFVTRFDHYRALYGESYKTAAVRTGDPQFRPLKGAALAGFRLRYDLSPSLGLSIGVQYLGRDQRSDVGMTVDVSDPGGGPRSYGFRNAGFLLGTTAWSPQLGAHFGWPFGRVLRLEAHIAGGPVYVSCHAASERRMETIDAAGVETGVLEAVDMRGTARGFSGELGARLGARLGGSLAVFAEAAFAFRSVSEVRGPGSSRSETSGPVAPGSSSGSWTGEWITVKTDIAAAWGKIALIAPQNWPAPVVYGGMGAGKFTLDLSGFQWKGGIAVRL